jgi:hypothetical protein
VVRWRRAKNLTIYATSGQNLNFELWDILTATCEGPDVEPNGMSGVTPHFPANRQNETVISMFATLRIDSVCGTHEALLR